MKRLNGENVRRKNYGYGPVVVLMAACVCVMVAIVLAFILPDSLEVKNTDNKIEISESIAKETEEVAEMVVEQTETEILPENLTQQEEISETEAEEEKPLFTVSDKSYFDDALFIGDSRTVGIKKYGVFDNADYFASAGLSLYSIGGAKVEMEDGKKVKLEEMLSENTYGKVYIMLGINELGYDFDTTIGKYQAFIDYVFGFQPDAIVYVCANMHVNSLRNELDDIHNNAAINRMNEQISQFADNEKIFYLDVNPLFDDENGNLAQEYVSDDTHLMGMYYEMWCNWYCENTVAVPDC